MICRKDLLLSSQQLAARCDPDSFSFETTEELKKTPMELIGQNQAQEAMEFGLQMKQEDYHIFLAGPGGTGRTTFARLKTEQYAVQENTPKDIIYIHNFDSPDAPAFIEFPAGEGSLFAGNIEEMIYEIKEEINKALTGDRFERQKMDMAQTQENELHDKWQQLEKRARDQQFALDKKQQGVVAVPLTKEGVPHSEESFEELDEITKQQIMEKSKILTKDVNATLRQQQIMRKSLKKKWQDAEELMVGQSIYGPLEEMIEAYREIPKAISYIESIRKEIIKKWKILFQEKEDKNSRVIPAEFSVNILVSHKSGRGAPVIHETYPSYSNLFGKIDPKPTLPSLEVDVSMLTGGALHRANGGYLILEAAELLSHPYCWQALKQMLRSGLLRMEALANEAAGGFRSPLKPEPLPVDIKVILIGTFSQFDYLFQIDEVFRKLFRVKVEFETSMERTFQHIEEYAAFIAYICRRNQLLHVHKQALAKIIDYSTRLVNDRRKLSARFHLITEVLMEADYWARKDKAAFIEAGHVRLARNKKQSRTNQMEKAMQDTIDDGTIMISTEGSAIGQINALVVSKRGDMSFGLPTRVSARTYVGRNGIVNIDRESFLTGPIHTKGLHILSGYLQAEFAQDDPLPLAASITFEQSYNMVDGDSASSTELYALLSSLAEIPLRQDVAVTGSVNQFGDVQPIGGVNEKVEGFYFVCKRRGLTGTQGVIIPKLNSTNLMLRNEILEAVEQGSFHIWAVSSIKEGMEVLTGVPGGKKTPAGIYEKQSVFGMVQERITAMANKMKKIEREQ